jgi:spore germination protein PC
MANTLTEKEVSSIMHSGMSWQQQLQQLYSHIAWQAKRIEQLEQKLTKLEVDVAAVKDQKHFHIDKIEYKFDQLKVEKLEGTLTIGVTPATLDTIEDFTVNGKNLGTDGNSNGGAIPAQPTWFDVLKGQVSSCIDSYLNIEAQDDMARIGDKYRFPLDESYQQFIVDEIRGQVEARIQHYLGQYRSAGMAQPTEAVKQAIIEKTKADIRTAMEMYISNLPGKEEEPQ